MIADLDSPDQPSAIAADVCVVGTGAVGIALAREFARSPFRVVLLESGSFDDEPRTQELYEVDSTGLPFHGATEGRFRTYGGSTTRWGGQALPLSKLDFEPRDWVPHSGWPLSLADIEPYYLRAADYLKVDRQNYDTDLFAMLKTDPPAFDPACVRFHYAKWSPAPHMRETYGTLLRKSQNVTVLFHANLVNIELDEPNCHVKSLAIQSLTGKTASISARYVVLAMGGIETVRILLASNRQIPAGIGNSRGALGRFFQDHPGAAVGNVETPRPRELAWIFSTVMHRGLKYSARVSASEVFQKNHRVLNASASIISTVDPDTALNRAKSAYRLLRTGKLGGEFFATLGWSLLHAPVLLRPAWHLLVHKRVYVPAPYRLGITCEQEPSDDSFIRLSDQRDALGMPRARIEWKLSPMVRRTMAVFAKMLANEFRRTGLAEITLDPWILDESLPWQEHMSDQFHHMGATRMSANAAQGVVDPDCFVHGIENLAVASSSVFPTSGHSNPTFTLLALTTRLADELKRRLAGRGAEA